MSREPKWADLFGADPNYTDGKPVEQWLHEQRTGHHDEREAFEHVVTYHYRAASDRCACGELPLGSSHATHQWDEFVKARTSA